MPLRVRSKTRSQRPKTVKSVIFAPAATTFSHAVAKRLINARSKYTKLNIYDVTPFRNCICNNSGPSGFLNQRAVTVTCSTGRPSQRADFDGSRKRLDLRPKFVWNVDRKHINLCPSEALLGYDLKWHWTEIQWGQISDIRRFAIYWPILLKI